MLQPIILQFEDSPFPPDTDTKLDNKENISSNGIKEKYYINVQSIQSDAYLGIKLVELDVRSFSSTLLYVWELRTNYILLTHDV